jgi:hypothetical protein
MKRITTGVYTAPQVKELNVRVEAGFATSVTIDGITPEDGAWDE